MTIKCSICMSTTRGKGEYLARTLDAITSQGTGFDIELIVSVDGCDDKTKQVLNDVSLCRKMRRFRAIYLENDTYRNPSFARNQAYKQARGEIVVAMSDDVIMADENTLQMLVDELRVGEFCIATVHNYDPIKRRLKPYAGRLTEYTGLTNRRAFFFLGALWRRDLYAVGGCDCDFTAPAFDDDRFSDSLIHGLGLKPRFLDSAIGYHQSHPRPKNLRHLVKPSEKLYKRKTEAAKNGTGSWLSPGAPWPLT